MAYTPDLKRFIDKLPKDFQDRLPALSTEKYTGTGSDSQTVAFSSTILGMPVVYELMADTTAGTDSDDIGQIREIKNVSSFTAGTAQGCTWTAATYTVTFGSAAGGGFIPANGQPMYFIYLDEADIGDLGAIAKQDDSAFTPGSDMVAMVGAEFDDVAPDSVNEGDAGALRMSGNRNLYVQIRDASSERSAHVESGTKQALNVNITDGTNDMPTMDARARAGFVQTDGEYNVSTNTNPDDIGIMVSANNVTPATTTQTVRPTGGVSSSSITSNTFFGLDTRSKLYGTNGANEKAVDVDDTFAIKANPASKLISDFETYTDYAALGDNTSTIASASNHLTGSSAISFNKIGTGANTYAGIDDTTTTIVTSGFKASDYIEFSIYLSSLADVASVEVRLGNSSSVYTAWTVDDGQLVTGWNTCRVKIGDGVVTSTGWAQSSTVYHAIVVNFDAAGSTLSGIIVDNLIIIASTISESKSLLYADNNGTSKELQSDNLGSLFAQPGRKDIASFKSTSGWAVLNVDTAAPATSATHLTGSVSLNLNKSGGTLVYGGLVYTTPAVDYSGYGPSDVIEFVFNLASTTNVVSITFMIGTDASNCLQYTIPVAAMSAGWNTIQKKISECTSSGNGWNQAAVTFVEILLEVDLVASTKSVLIDYMGIRQAPVQQAIISSSAGSLSLADDSEAAIATRTWVAATWATSTWYAPTVSDASFDMADYDEAELEWNTNGINTNSPTLDIGILESIDDTTWTSTPYQLNNDSIPLNKDEVHITVITKGARYIKPRVYNQVIAVTDGEGLTCRIVGRRKNRSS